MAVEAKADALVTSVRRGFEPTAEPIADALAAAATFIHSPRQTRTAPLATIR